MFKDVDEIKKHFSGVQKNMTTKTVMPFVDQAAIRYIIPAIGEEFYGEIKEAYKGDTTDTKLKNAIEHIQRALAYYTFLDALPFLSMAIGDLGAHETQTQNSTPVRQWVYNNMEAACAASADIFLDNLLLFLETKADDYPTWKNSEAYTVSKELFFTSASEISRYINIGNSRRAYLVLRTYIRRAEDMYLLPVLGSDLFEDLKAKHKANSFSADEKKLFEKMRKPLAQHTLSEALTEAGMLISGFQIVGGGIRIVNDNEGVKQRLATSPEQLSALKNNAEKLAAMYRNDLKLYLDNNADTFELYKNSTFYVDQTIRRTYQLPDNSNSPSFRV